MKSITNIQCQHCGESVSLKAVFCQACGGRLSNNDTCDTTPASRLDSRDEKTEVQSHQGRNQDFLKLRILNWAIVVLLLSGAALMLFRSNHSMGAFLLISGFMLFAISPFLLTAIALSKEIVFFAGIPVAAKKSQIKKAAIVCNLVAGIFGVLGLVACIATNQFIPMLSMLIYVIPPTINFRVLRTLLLPEKN